ncbi:hypothetical protein [Halosolutus gelatinilyticus]|uniref:hypothetical protein n=1 Tax=Halosolutus gelatinilyticus TaxID=2931975 RepID=UPI001FF4DCCC|nr:hypothetical protein [Halosolutus gelatinilyticus]
MLDTTSEEAAKPPSESATDRIKQWLLLDGDRSAIAAFVAIAFGLTYLALSVSGLAPLTDMQSLFYAFSGMIAGNFTLITVVVSINQLLLSRELQSPGELESEISETRKSSADGSRTADATSAFRAPTQAMSRLVSIATSSTSSSLIVSVG